jgi:hypothetical protein
MGVFIGASNNKLTRISVLRVKSRGVFFTMLVAVDDCEESCLAKLKRFGDFDVERTEEGILVWVVLFDTPNRGKVILELQVIHDRLHSPSRHFLLGLVLSEFVEFFSLFAHVAAPRPLNLSLNLTPIPLVSVRTLAHEESSLASHAAQAIHILHLHNIVLVVFLVQVAPPPCPHLIHCHSVKMLGRKASRTATPAIHIRLHPFGYEDTKYQRQI